MFAPTRWMLSGGTGDSSQPSTHNTPEFLSVAWSRPVSLVAHDGAAVIGHALFTPVTLDDIDLSVAGLGPVAVSPAHQRRGIGGAMVREGLAECRRMGFVAVVVLGHPDYYPKFGFVPASRFGIRCEYEVPDEVFMALELQAGSLASRAGVARYHSAFAELGC